MGYYFTDPDGHLNALCRALHDFRWKFDKNAEYPDLGPWHPNLLIETAIDELRHQDERIKAAFGNPSEEIDERWAQSRQEIAESKKRLETLTNTQHERTHQEP